MRKSNPLFVDSTKFQGDTILTSIELDEVCAYFGESVYVRIQEKGGKEKVIHLSPKSGGLWCGQTHLSHQKPVEYQFFLTKDDEVIATMPAIATRATYLIREAWRPLEMRFFDREEIPEVTGRLDLDSHEELFETI